MKETKKEELKEKKSKNKNSKKSETSKSNKKKLKAKKEKSKAKEAKSNLFIDIKNKVVKIDLSKNKFNTLEIILIFIMALVFGLLAGEMIFSGSEKTTLSSLTNSNSDISEISNVYSTILNEYIDKVDKDKLKQAAINGMLSTLNDRHTSYLDEEETKQFENELNAYFYGMGAVVSQSKNDLVTIEEVYKNSPAEKVGLKKGDKYLKINGKDVTKLTPSQIGEKIKKTNGKEFELTIKRKAEEKTFKIKIDKVEIPSVKSKIIKKENKKIGYIQLTIFAANTDEQLQEHLKKLEKENIEDLIIDLRYNKGGQADTVLNIGSEFLDKDVPIMQICTKTKKEIKYSKGNKNKNYKNIIVLTNEGTASAAEVLTAALNEQLNATIIGETTYGKGTVQKTKQLSDGTLIKYTIQTWKTSKGKSINEKGVTPTIRVEQSKEYYKTLQDKDDTQLQKAILELKNK